MIAVHLTLVFAFVACGGESTLDSPGEPTDGGAASETVAAAPVTSPFIGEPPSSRTTDSTRTDPADQIPSGTVALFYRVAFETKTERLRSSGGNITWESGRRGIARYTPSNGQVVVIKTITSPSYAKSAIYPVTLGGRLFAIRDWGVDWAVKNKRFDIEELDPRSGATLSSTQIRAEWFTIAGNRVYFMSEVETDLFGNARGGGVLTMKDLGPTTATELPMRDSYFVAVGDQIASISGSTVRTHDPSTGEVQASVELAPGSIDRIWPTAANVFYGDDAIYWAEETGRAKEVAIVRFRLTGAVERLANMGLEEDETSLVIDQDGGHIMVSTVGPEPLRGIVIKRVLLLDTDEKKLEEVPINQHISPARKEAGGGVQILVMD